MKTQCIALGCALLIGFCSSAPASVMEDKSPEAIATDVIVVRPACFVATVVGSALFVLSLPFAAISGSVKTTGSSLVGKPARATFTREVGDLSVLQE